MRLILEVLQYMIILNTSSDDKVVIMMTFPFQCFIDCMEASVILASSAKRLGGVSLTALEKLRQRTFVSL